MYVCMCVCSRWQTVISIIVCRVVISQVNQCHVVAPAVNLTLADRWHSICDSFTALNSRRVAQKKRIDSHREVEQDKSKKMKKEEEEEEKIRPSRFFLKPTADFFNRRVSSLIDSTLSTL